MTVDGFDSGLAALERALAISKHENDKVLEARPKPTWLMYMGSMRIGKSA